MPKGAKLRAKGVYGKPWSKLVGQKVEITPKILKRLGKALVDSVVEEARKDFAKQGKKPTPEGLPASESFFKSFGYKVVGQSTVAVTSTWPWLEQIRDGREPYKMTWLTRPRGVNRVPMPQKDGTVLIRMAPLKIRDAWIHPGFARHTFLERGIRKGRKKMAEIVSAEVLKELKRGDPFS